MLFNSDFERLTTLGFSKDSQGRDIFYPLGFPRRARILPDPASAEDLRRTVVSVTRVTALVTVSLVVAMLLLRVSIPYAFAAGLLAAFCPSFYFRWLVRGLPISDERLGYWEIQRRTGDAVSTKWLLSMALLCSLGLRPVVSQIGGAELGWTDVILAALAGLGFAYWILQLVWKMKRTDNTSSGT
jgi:hypothetical protein